MSINVNEIWKDIPGYLLFQASNTGRVKHLAYSYTNARGYVVNIPEREITTFINPKGYMRCDLCIQGEKKKPFTVHRLVMYAFKGMPPIGMDQINHKDGNKLNNDPDNLEWSNNSLNITHAWATGLFKPVLPKGVNFGRATILVHSEYGYFCNIIEAAALQNISRHKMGKMVQNKINNTTKSYTPDFIISPNLVIEVKGRMFEENYIKFINFLDQYKEMNVILIWGKIQKEYVENLQKNTNLYILNFNKFSIDLLHLIEEYNICPS